MSSACWRPKSWPTRRWCTIVYATCLRVLRNAHDAADATQEVAMKWVQEHAAIRGSNGLALAGCGVGGGGPPAAGQGSSTTAQQPGTRDVPGGSMTVSRIGGIQPGTTAAFRIAVSTGGGGSPIAALEAWIGHDYDPSAAAVAATPVAGADGIYEVRMAVPGRTSPR